MLQHVRTFSFEPPVAGLRGLVLSILMVILASCDDRANPESQEDRSSNPDDSAQSVFVANADDPMADYVGTQACAECHAEIVADFLKTAHHNTSRKGLRTNVLGSLESAHNTVKINDEMHIRISERNSKLYQVAIYGDDTTQAAYRRAVPMDIVVGSGRKGQTYLGWQEDSLLFQLPISYYTVTDEWVLSPGYTSETVGFDRPVVTRCVECHATYFESQLPWEIGDKVNKLSPETIGETSAADAAEFMAHQINAYVPGKNILGISCEKCHTPGRAHVEFHRKNPAETAAQYIVNTANLSRERNLDLCSWCHSGVTGILQEPFSYQAGQPLDSFFVPVESADPADLDVHGNQVGLLKLSECFTQSNDMTCTTCHDPHKKQRDLAFFNSKCQTCHSDADCGMHGTENVDLGGMCIDCHMPQSQSRSLLVEAHSREAEGVDVRTHYIAIYPQQSDAVLQKLESAH